MSPSWVPRLAVGVCVLLATACSNAETDKQRYLENGKRLAAEKKFNEATVEYRNAIRIDGRFGEARWRLAQAYEETENFPGALQEYVRAADLLPDNVEVQVKAATHLLLDRQFLDAKARADKALAKDPRNGEAFIVRANATAGLKDLPGAIKDMEDAVKANAEDGRVLTSLGSLQLSQGDSAEAEANFKRALQINPNSIEARLALANFYLSTRQDAEAERQLNEARTLSPKHVLVNRMLAGFYLSHGRPNEAEAPLTAVAEGSKDSQAKILLADYYILLRRYAQAAAVLKPIGEAEAPLSSAVLRLAAIERTEGRNDAAKKMLTALIQQEPKNAEALTTRSTWALQDGEIETAVTSGRAATEADPKSAAAYLALGRALAKKGDAGAIAALNEATRLNPRMAAAQVLLSNLYLASRDITAAEASANDARRTAAAVPDVRLAVARTMLAQGRVREAQTEIKAVLTTVPDAPAANALQGLALMANKDAAGARAAFTRALEKEPLLPEALEGLTVLDSRTGNSAQAIARIEALIASHPKEASLRFIAGTAYGAAGQRDKVEQAFLAGLELDPSHMPAYEVLGRLYTSTGRLDEAKKQFEAAAARQPGQVGAATMVGNILEMQGKPEEARKRYEAIVAGNPRGAAVAANNLAFMLAEQGDNLEIALQHAQAAKAQLPQNAAVNDTLGWIYYKRNLPHIAIPFLEQSVASAPNNAEFQLHLGLSYVKAGDMVRGRQALETALKLNPKIKHADEARSAVAASR